MVVDPDIAVKPVQRPAQSAKYLLLPERGQQSVMARVGRRAARFHRHMKQQLMPSRPRIAGLGIQVIAIGNEGDRNRRRQFAGPFGAVLHHAGIVDDDGNHRPIIPLPRYNRICQPFRL